MEKFEGSLLVLATSDSLDAVFAVDEEHLTVTSGGHHIAEWDLAEVSGERTVGGFHLTVAGEELLFSTLYPEAFAAAVGITDERRRWFRSKRKRAQRKQRTGPVVDASRPTPVEAPEVRQEPDAVTPASGHRGRAIVRQLRRIPIRWRLVIGGAFGVGVLSVLFPAFVALSLAFTGLVMLIVAALMAADDILVVSRLPAWINEWVLLGGGIGLLILGLALIAAT